VQLRESRGGTAGGLALRAARLYGAAQALRERIGAALTPLERLEFERHQEILRAALTPETLEATWAEGQTISLEEVIVYALEERTSL
jgi:hypothetical protein